MQKANTKRTSKKHIKRAPQKDEYQEHIKRAH